MLDAQGTSNSEYVGVVVELQIATRGHSVTGETRSGSPLSQRSASHWHAVTGMRFIATLLSSIAHLTSYNGQCLNVQQHGLLNN